MQKKHTKNVRSEYTEKVEALREFFLEIVDRNFVARCRYVQIFFEPESGGFVRIVNELNPRPIFDSWAQDYRTVIENVSLPEI